MARIYTTFLTMTTINDIINSGRFTCSWSTYRNIASCDRKGWQQVILGRESAKDDKIELIFGKAIHAGLDARQKALMTGERVSVDVMQAQAMREFPLNLVMPEKEHRTLGKVKEVLGLYKQQYANDRWKIVSSEEEILDYEVGELDWVHPEFGRQRTRLIWEAHIDGIWEDDTGQAIKDTKTTRWGSLVGEDYDKLVRFYRMSGQFKMYCLLKGLNKGVLDYIIVRPPLKYPKPDSRSDIEMERIPLEFSDESIDECLHDVQWTLSRWLEACSQRVAPPMRGIGTGECKWCPYLTVCEQEGETNRMNWLFSGHFKQWEPLRRGDA